MVTKQSDLQMDDLTPASGPLRPKLGVSFNARIDFLKKQILRLKIMISILFFTCFVVLSYLSNGDYRVTLATLSLMFRKCHRLSNTFAQLLEQCVFSAFAVPCDGKRIISQLYIIACCFHFGELPMVFSVFAGHLGLGGFVRGLHDRAVLDQRLP